LGYEFGPTGLVVVKLTVENFVARAAIRAGAGEADGSAQFGLYVVQQVKWAGLDVPGIPAQNGAVVSQTLDLPKEVEHWSLTTLREKLVKIGAKAVRHGLVLTPPASLGAAARY
jgi:hypothetical protein